MMKIGILRETKSLHDTRVPLTPEHCKAITENFPGTMVYVQPSSFRCFTNAEYENKGVILRENLADCDILFGVKEVKIEEIIPGKTYLFFSHTIKKQSHNKKLLQHLLQKRIRLIDYEMLTDNKGVRIIGFGRWAGIIGAYQGIRALCLKQGNNQLPTPRHFKELHEMNQFASSVHLPAVKIVITGSGRVATGSEEMMGAFKIPEISVKEFLSNTIEETPVYVLLDPEQYNKRKDGQAFTLQHFFKYPQAYQTDFARFYDKSDLLIMAAYWDPQAPVLMTTEDMRDRSFKIRVIADISCDLNGAVPSTIKTTTFEDPYYDYNPVTRKVELPFSSPSNITVMAIDNLPSGLPREASSDFGQSIMKHVLPLILHEDKEQIIQKATITRDGRLAPNFGYLSEWVSQPD